ncbi:MAG: amidohydrolase family protein [Archaeoglobus sp.]|nr:amidohydrolase family protein [Archaeoglobus sp.]
MSLVLEGRILNPATEFVGKGRIVVENGKIKDVGSKGEVEIPEGAEVIETKAKATIMPGLIDAHVHFTGFRTGDYIKEGLLTPLGLFVARAIKDLEATLDAGYTTVCDAGSIVALHLREAVNEGTVRGPRIIAAGYPISQTFGHGDFHFLHPKLVDARESLLNFPFQSLLCDGEDECRKAARHALREGADFIKIFVTGGVASQRDRPEYPQLTRKEIAAIVEEAKRAGRFVHAHAESSEGYINAVEEGVEVLAHGMDLNDDAINLSIEKDITLIPTLTIADIILKFGEAAGLPDWAIEKTEEVHEIHIESIKRAYEAGVRIATGTDFFIGSKEIQLYGMNSLEIKLLAEKVGMEGMEVLKAATLNAAKAAHLNAGSLEKGKVADIIVVEGDPLSPEILLDKRKIKLVVKGGRIVKIVKNDLIGF